MFSKHESDNRIKLNTNREYLKLKNMFGSGQKESWLNRIKVKLLHKFLENSLSKDLINVKRNFEKSSILKLSVILK